MRQLRDMLERRDEGTTLIEIITVLSIMGVCLALAGVGVTSWVTNRQHAGTAEQLVSFLRQAQQRAQTEVKDYCVTFDSGTEWSMRPGGCTAAPGARGQPEASTVMVAADFTQFDGTSAAQVQFTPRGVATPGTVTVSRPGRSSITITVEGLTGRVSST